MVWLTVLTVWAVNNISNSLSNQSVSVQGIPAVSTPQQISTIQMDKDTVWVLQPFSDSIQVITHDKDGYHITQSKMSIQNQ